MINHDVELPHLNLEKTVVYDKFYLEIDSTYCDERGVLEKFEIINIITKTIRNDLASRFKAKYLVLYDRSERQFFFIKDALCILHEIRNNISSDSNDYIEYRSLYQIRFDSSLLYGGYMTTIELNDWYHFHGDFFNERDPAAFRLRSIDNSRRPESLQQRTWARTPNMDIQQIESPHPNLFDSRNEWETLTLTPIGMREPIVFYRHTETGVTARTESEVELKSKKISKKREKIKARNLETLNYYLSRKKHKRYKKKVMVEI